MHSLVEEIIELNKSNVYIRNRDELNQKINDLIQGGYNKLQVVSDFDKTITKQHENGTNHLSSFAMFSKCPSVTEKHIKYTEALAAKYIPIENDPTISTLEKTEYMKKWWDLTEVALTGLKVSREEVNKVSIQLGPSLRTGTKELFDDLNKVDVPILVFSAGLGDMVECVLKNCGVLLPNVEVVSNFLKYDDDGSILGFKHDIIHVYNKNEYAIKGTNFYNRILDRDNVILMGDSIGDASMVEGMDHLTTVIKIGFLYERSDEHLPNYMNTFDIVLQDDQTMDVPRAILDCIKKSRAQKISD